MEIRVVIVSLACLACLVPPALGTGLVVKAAAIGAAKGAIIGGIKGAAIGAGVGLAAKGAAALVAKKALLGILLKVAALKAPALLAMKKSALRGIGSLASKGLRGALAVNEMVYDMSYRSRPECPPTRFKSPLLQILSGTTRVLQTALRPCEVVRESSPVVYRILPASRVIAVSV